MENPIVYEIFCSYLLLFVISRYFTDKYEDATVFQRLTLIDNEYPGAAILLHKRGIMIKVL